MARPLRIQFEGALYHLVVQANHRQPLFRDPMDRRRYLELLGRYRDQFGCRVYAYVLMRRFAHLLLETPRGNISKVMQCLGTSYTSYFNRRHKRNGTLFGGRYKSSVVDKERGLPGMTRYIHRRHLKSNFRGRKKRDYSWSSYRIYLGRAVSDFVETEPVLTRFGRRIKEQQKSYRRFVEGKSEWKDDTPASVQSRPIAGSWEFVERAPSRVGSLRKDDGETPLKKAERILREVELCLDSREARELWKGRRALGRHVAMYVIRSQTTLPLRSIGELLGVKAPAVAIAIAKIGRLLKQNDFSNSLQSLIRIERFSSSDQS